MRWLVRLIRGGITLYGYWSLFRNRRWLAMLVAAWRLWRRRPLRDARRRAQWLFVTAGEPAIYRRRGVRRIGSR
ncbi:MAG: hypothetical protein IRZ10_02420 [Thermoflavifilum sp.]|nr:hypothetical protein [Thermoflavifilum sp.]MCL6513248.1 hypothetical protein [Alicyclobacillus sp.]